MQVADGSSLNTALSNVIGISLEQLEIDVQAYLAQK